MREYIPAVRGLLAGEELSVDGRYVTLEGVRLERPPQVAPAVYAAAEGPKTLRLSGEVADGTILNGGYPPDVLANWVQSVREARTSSGREGEHEFVAYAMTAFGSDVEERVYAALAVWDQPADLDRALTGTPEQVAHSLQKWVDAGVDAVVLQPLPGEPDPVGFLGLCGEVRRLVASA